MRVYGAAPAEARYQISGVVNALGIFSIVLRGQDFRGRIASSYDKRKEHIFFYIIQSAATPNAFTSVNVCSKYLFELRRV